ncbi:hypothetical protein KY320_01465 [Candidatus Woesearchaeota archaeon]|nr:hypothetical protein [Candidatus Woesearchaeota archaeon]
MKVQIDLKKLTKEQLIELIESGAFSDGQKLSPPKPVFYARKKSKKRKRHSKYDQLAADIASKIKRPTLYGKLRKVQRLSGGNRNALIRSLKARDDVILSKEGSRWVIYPTKGRDGRPTIPTKAARQRQRRESEWNKFCRGDGGIAKYMKLGYSMGDAIRMASVDYAKHKKPKRTIQKFPWFDSISDEANMIVDGMIKNAISNGTPLTYNQDGAMLGIEQYAKWIEFAREMLSLNDSIKAFFGDNSSKSWKFIDRQLWYK